MSNCEPTFLKRPMVLFRPFTVFPRTTCGSDIINIVVRVLLLVGIFGTISMYVAPQITYHIMAGTFALFILPAIVTSVKGYGAAPSSGSEGFTESGALDGTKLMQLAKAPRPVSDARTETGTIMLPSASGMPWTEPTPNNPFMNVLADQYKYETFRPSAADPTSPDVKQSLDDYFRIQWFSDPTDVFGRNQGQRQFYTMPSTSIPSDRKSYQEWLYKIPGKTCKEGNGAACLAGTDGGKIPWLSMDA
jgi:hypothetical protein